MDFNRIDKELKASIDSSPSYELELEILEHQPAKLRNEIAAAVLQYLPKAPDTIKVQDFYTESSIDGYKIRLRTYQPKEFGKSKVILYFHGGGYVFGLPENSDAQLFRIADSVKATIISVDYRLAPENKFPVPVQDGYDGLTWIINKGKEVLNINPESITVLGASAGGHLAAAIAQMAVDKQVKNIKHQILLYPVIHNKFDTASMKELADAPLWNKKGAEIAWNHFLGEENAGKSIRYADLTNFDQFNKLPRTTIIGAELDPLRDEDIEYAKLLYCAGVSTELWIIPGAVHIFDYFPSEITERFYRFLSERLK